jgi:hypothetical protein
MHKIQVPLLELLGKAPLFELLDSQCDYNYAITKASLLQCDCIYAITNTKTSSCNGTVM